MQRKKGTRGPGRGAREEGSPDRLPAADCPRGWARAPSPSLAAWGALALLAAGLACRERPAPPQGPERPREGVPVRVLCPDERAAAIVTRYSQPWASREGAQVQVVVGRPQETTSEEPADVWILAPAHMPHWAAAGQLRPVPETCTAPGAAYAWDGLLPLYRSYLAVWDGQAYALPLLGDASLCFYRTDLFEDAQHQAAFRKQFGRELRPPDTWQEFAEVAAYFNHRNRPGIEHPCPSLPPLPADADELDRLFYEAAVPFARRAVRERESVPEDEAFSFHYDLATGAVRIDTPGFVHALALLQRLQACRPAGTSPEPPVHFQRGEAVLCLASPAWISRFQQNPALRGKFNFRRPPGSRVVFDYHTGREQAVRDDNRVPYLGAGGYLSVVPQTSRRPEAAFSLLAFLSDPKTSGDIVIEPTWGGGVLRRSQFAIQAGWQAFDLPPEQTSHLVESLRMSLVHPQVTNPVLRLRTPDEHEHQVALDEAVRAALTGGKDPAAALAAAARRWRELDTRKDLKTRLRDYRLSLSLGGSD